MNLNTVLRIAFPVVVLGLGLAGTVALIETRPEPEHNDAAATATLVEVLHVSAHVHQIAIEAQGTVVPAQSIVLQPEVGGRVVWQSDDLVPGGRVTKGQRLVRIDARNYQAAVQRMEAERNRALLQMELERGRQVVARREWDLFQEETASATPEGRALALRQPQIQSARVNLQAAESTAERARLDLRRTTITAPFDAIVQAESVDLGQLVGPQSRLATLIGSERFWVRVSVPLEVLDRIDVPGINAAEGAEARVWQDVGESRIERTGRVLRLYGDLDPIGRMARVLVGIEDPLAPGDGETPSALPLLVGAYVHVDIRGRSEESLFEVPRSALREGDQVYVMGDGHLLEIRAVTIAWRREDSVLVRSGLAEGEAIVTSRIPTPISGMALRTATQDEHEQHAEAPEGEATTAAP